MNHFVRYEDLPLRGKKGQSHQVEFVSNLYDEDGRNVIQCNIRDITGRKRSEQALLVAKNEISLHASHLEHVVAKRTSQLRETVEELEAFSYSVSHDMRDSLRAMQSYAHFLMEEYSGKLDEQGATFGTVRLIGHHLEAIYSVLKQHDLDFARPSDLTDPCRAEIEIRKIVLRIPKTPSRNGLTRLHSVPFTMSTVSGA